MVLFKFVVPDTFNDDIIVVILFIVVVPDIFVLFNVVGPDTFNVDLNRVAGYRRWILNCWRRRSWMWI